jgi:hypothetical protein
MARPIAVPMSIILTEKHWRAKNNSIITFRNLQKASFFPMNGLLFPLDI